jgi:hypothetical protein
MPAEFLEPIGRHDQEMTVLLPHIERRIPGVRNVAPPRSTAENNLARMKAATVSLAKDLQTLFDKINIGPRRDLPVAREIASKLSAIIEGRLQNLELSRADRADVTRFLASVIENSEYFRFQEGQIDIRDNSIKSLEVMYSSLVDLYETTLDNMNLTSKEYYKAVSDVRAAVGLDPLHQPYPRLFVYARRNGKDVKIPRSLLVAIREELNQGRGGSTRLPAVRELIERFDAPLQAKLAGYALYLVNIALGQLVGGKAQDFASHFGGAAAARTAENAEQEVADAPRKAVTLLNAVRFGLMTRRAGDSTAPALSTVLRCAAVNGGLVLGVTISDP